MTNYNRLKDVHEIIDWLKSSKYYNALSYDFSSEECVLNNQSINIKLFRLEIQEKHNTVFLNGENFKYALITICQAKTDNLNELDSFTLLIKDILQSNKYRDKEYVQVKDILISLNIHASNFKKEESKIAKVLKRLGYEKKVKDKAKVWTLTSLPGLTSSETVLEPLLHIDCNQVNQLNQKLTESQERVNTLENYIIEINKELQTYKLENTKLLNTTLEFANKIKDLEAKVPKEVTRFAAPNRFEYNPLLDLED